MKDLIDRVRALRVEYSKEYLEDFLTQSYEMSIPLLEAALKRLKAEEQEILSGPMLEWMQENDQLTFETEELKAKIKTYVSPKIEEGQEEKAYQWLVDHEYGPLIKDTLSFAKGELDEETVVFLAQQRGKTFSRKQSIHHQSLKKIVSDRLEAGDILPDEEDGISVKFFDAVELKEKK